MNNTIDRPEDMDQQQLSALLADMLHRMTVHETLWFREVEHQLGMDNALEIMDEAWTATRDISKRRLQEASASLMPAVIPSDPGAIPSDTLLSLLDMTAKNWLAQDGVWFQAVEKRFGMNDAKRCNDSTWGRFSVFEAASVKKLLHLEEHPGLSGLERALNFRLYGRLNKQSCRYDDTGALIFTMDRCRVQAARKRKHLPDYPCKSAGLVEYSRFAAGIDNRIMTECICCPPDEHPAEYDCGWRFYLASSEAHVIMHNFF